MEKQEIHFYSGGHKLKGHWYPPKAGSPLPAPGIVCCHGFAMIETPIVAIPQALSEAGYGVVTFYCRGLGDSEGPRGRVIPLEQVEDIRNAVTYLQTRSEIDPKRIGVFGSAWGCGIAVNAAALDRRIKALVGTVGIGDFERWLKSERPRWEWRKFTQRLEEDRKKRVLTGQSEIVHPDEIHIPDQPPSKARVERWNAFIKKSGYTGYPLETAEAMVEFKPERVVDRISPGAVCFIHMELDITVPPEESLTLYAKANEPKKLVIMEGRGHYDTFINPEVFKDVMAIAIDWFATHISAHRPA